MSSSHHHRLAQFLSVHCLSVARPKTTDFPLTSLSYIAGLCCHPVCKETLPSTILTPFSRLFPLFFSLVAAITGVGIAAYGGHAVRWGGLVEIFLGWLASPFLAGIVAAILFIGTRALILESPDSIRRATLMIPFYFCGTFTVIAFFTVYKVSSPFCCAFCSACNCVLLMFIQRRFKPWFDTNETWQGHDKREECCSCRWIHAMIQNQSSRYFPLFVRVLPLTAMTLLFFVSHAHIFQGAPNLDLDKLPIGESCRQFSFPIHVCQPTAYQ